MSDHGMFGVRNRKRFIDKHQNPWQDRTHLSWRAWLQDARYVLSQSRSDIFASSMDLYKEGVLALSKTLDERYAYLKKALSNMREIKDDEHPLPRKNRIYRSWWAWRQNACDVFSRRCPNAFSFTRSLYKRGALALSKISAKQRLDLPQAPNATHKAEGELEQGTLAVQTVFEDMSSHVPLEQADLDSFAQAGERLEENIRLRASEIAAMEAEMQPEEECPLSIMEPALSGPHVSEDLWTLLQHIDRGVVFFAGYPYPERLNDGYFQRVKAIDELMPDAYFRIYCDVSPAFSGENVLRRILHNTLLLQVNPQNVAHQLLVANCVQRCKKVYYHSVLRMEYPIQSAWLNEQSIHKILDVHGVVPEEFVYCSGDYTSSAFYSDIESRSVRQCDTIIVVSDAMGEHLSRKHAEDFTEKLITVPILPNMTVEERPRKYQPKRLPRLVYAGGTHPWQCIPRMLDAVERIIEQAEVDIFATRPQDIEKLGPRPLFTHPHFSLGTITHEELCGRYPMYDYGFLLREDVSVNRTACPTKLVEYLAYGIVPVLDSKYIGDFEKFGMRSVNITDLEQGNFLSPEQHEAYARHNITVLETLKKRSESNILRLKKALTQ